MDNSTVELTQRAARDLRRLSPDIRRRIALALQTLETDPRPPGCVKLKNGDEWRIRIGQYRVHYLIDDNSAAPVTVTSIGHRREIYRV
jgi:mRNA interferase RelE/StbE